MNPPTAQKKKRKEKRIGVSTASTTSGTLFVYMYPIIKFELPRFKFMKNQKPLYFHSVPEFKDFIKKLPKEWRMVVYATMPAKLRKLIG